MKKPATNRPCGGMGYKPAPKGTAAKFMGSGKPTNGGTAYAPKSGGKTSVSTKGPKGY